MLKAIGKLLHSATYGTWPTAMTSIRFVGYATVEGTSATLNLPTTGLTGGIDTQARTGDLLIVASGWTSTTDGNPGVLDATYTWTEVADLWANDAADAHLSVAYAHASSSPPATLSVSGNGYVGNGGGAVLYVLRGHDSGTPMDVAATSAAVINGNIVTPVAITPTTSGAVLVAIGLGGLVTANGITISDLSLGFAGKAIFQTTVGTTRNSAFGVCHKLWRNVGAETPGVWTFSGTNVNHSYCTVTLAIRPA